tara:strand:+ start:2347 stop:3186 length:840 start_codon:yes stop_codon:yes gene_type:complete
MIKVSEYQTAVRPIYKSSSEFFLYCGKLCTSCGVSAFSKSLKEIGIMVKHLISRAGELFAGSGRYAPLTQANEGRTGAPMEVITKIDMGTPIVGDPNGIVVSQNLTALGVFSSSGTAAAAIAAGALAGTMDYPRNIVAAWTGTAVITITGTDVYDVALVQTSASGTSLTGTKAFKTVTNVSVSGNVTSLTVGTGDVLGIPYALAGEHDVVSFYADAVEEKLAATFVSQVTTVATGLTGDTRGTVNPNTTLDGSVQLYLRMAVAGIDSREGLVGVTQFGG